MTTDNLLHNNDPLATLFDRLPHEAPPPNLRDKVMQQIQHEARKAKQRSEYLSLLPPTLASLLIIAIAAAAVLRLGIPNIPNINHLLPNISPLTPFYLYIGAIALALLALDHLLRHSRRHP